MLNAIINIFITNLIISTSCFSLGRCALKIFKINLKFNFSISILIGIILTSQLGLILNFFLPINYISILIIIFLLLYFFKQLYSFESLIKLIIISLSSILFYYLGNNAEDYSLYHLTNLNVINDHKIVLGLANFKLNLGQSPISFYGDALFQNISLFNYKLNYLSFIGFSASIFYLEKILKNNKKLNFNDYFIIISITYFVLKFSRLGSHGADFLYLLITIFGIYFFLKIDFKNFKVSSNNKNIFLSLFFISNAYFFKVFSITYYILIFVILYFIIKNKIFKTYKNLIILIIIFNLVYFIKNFLISGCLIFPISETCFDFFDWNVGKYEIKNWRLINEAWTKGWDDTFALGYMDYISSFEWIKVWIKNHFIKSLEKLFLPLLIIIILTKIFIIKEIKHINNFNLNILIIFFVSLASIILWFFNSPLIRLGSGALLPFIIIILHKKPILNYNFKTSKFKLKIFITILISFFIFKNSVRIYSSSPNYENYPYPRINKDDHKIIQKNKITIHYENKVKYFYYSGTKCFTIKFPCISKNIKKKFIFKKKYGYLFLEKIIKLY